MLIKSSKPIYNRKEEIWNPKPVNVILEKESFSLV
jgi:hypothetical protein